MQPEGIIIVCELICIIVVFRLCVVLLGQKKRYQAWKQEQAIVEMKERFEAGRKENSK